MKEPLLDVNVANRGERGMLGIAISKVAEEKASGNLSSPITYVFLYFTESKTKDTGDLCKEFVENEVVGNRLYRYQLSEDGTQLINPKLLLSLPATIAAVHQGGKILIGPDDNLYLIVGDINHFTQTQNLKNNLQPNGTSIIYRITQDGLAPFDNPFGNHSSVNKFYAYGIRNSFGLDFDPITGHLWDTENGEDVFDEINLVEPGFNSGWTQIQGPSKLFRNFGEYNLVKNIFNQSSTEGKYRDPEFSWNLTVGVTDIKFFNSDKLGKQYENDMFVADVDNSNLYRFKLNQERTGLMLCGPLSDGVANTPKEAEDQLVVARGFGNIIDMEVSPDGYLYIAAIESYYPNVYDNGIIYKVVPSISESPNKENNQYLSNCHEDTKQKNP
jgi:glucose/arabinose dehydrogenase